MPSPIAHVLANMWIDLSRRPVVCVIVFIDTLIVFKIYGSFCGRRLDHDRSWARRRIGTNCRHRWRMTTPPGS
jgi:hypothetical protein